MVEEADMSKTTRINIGVILAVFSLLLSIGSVAYAAGTLGQKVHDVELRQEKLDTVPERVARIEAKIDILLTERGK